METVEFSDFLTQVKGAQAVILYSEQMPADTIKPFSGGSALAKSDAEKVLAQPAVKARVCAGLKNISEDLDKITEKVTEGLWPLALAGTLFIPQNPILYAWIGLLVFRATVTGFCIEFPKEE